MYGRDNTFELILYAARPEYTRTPDARSIRRIQGKDEASLLVRRGDAPEQCAGPRGGRLHAQGPAGNRAFPQTIGLGEQATQRHAVPIGHVDADLLRQPRRQGLAEKSEARTCARQSRAEKGVRASLIHSAGTGSVSFDRNQGGSRHPRSLYTDSADHYRPRQWRGNCSPAQTAGNLLGQFLAVGRRKAEVIADDASRCYRILSPRLVRHTRLRSREASSRALGALPSPPVERGRD
jgi:hypothetical protein